ncbi:hypothetical protein ACHMWU_20170 [Aeromicrobium sp. UC242_57]
MTSELPADLLTSTSLTRFVRRVRGRALRTSGRSTPARLRQLHLPADDLRRGRRHPGLKLAEELGVHKSTASRAAATLEKLGSHHSGA